MAPEQAQGLDTLDQRADVWALSAIVYECVAGRVPFSGTNGPSILLEILTKEPKPASAISRGQRHRAPPGLDLVLAQSFKKNPALRTATAGALADAVGGAYGLNGTHHDWATTPEAELRAAIEARLPALIQAASSASDQASLEALDELIDEMTSAAPEAGRKPDLPVGEVIASPSAQRTSWGVIAAVGGGALIVGVLIVLAVFLSR
jgi:serine/threonine-protein kinase